MFLACICSFVGGCLVTFGVLFLIAWFKLRSQFKAEKDFIKQANVILKGDSK